MSRASWDREIAVNLSGAFSCIQAVGARMAERGWGRVVNLSSVAAETPAQIQPAYAASKAGMIALTKTVAKAYARHGVTCNAVLPGLIATPLVRSMPPAVRDGLLQPVGRVRVRA
jgi:NAD(P)-dependent dehydrogenase (short-subunit alcohol dehydrogenase family)